ncbi:hypothetical protein Tco_1453876 [Tanacetum coccineum]
MIRLRAKAPFTSHSLPLPPPIILSHTRSDAPSSGTPPLLPMPLPTSSPPLHLLSTDRRADRPEVTLPPQKREIMRDLKRDVSYRITDTWDEMLVDMPGAPATDDTELGRRMTEFTTRVRQDTDKIYTRLDDEQTERQLMAGRLMMLYKDRHAHARTARLIEVVAQQVVIIELQAADRRRQAAITEMLAVDHKRQAQFIRALKLLKRLQTQMTESERQQGPAKGIIFSCDLKKMAPKKRTTRLNPKTTTTTPATTSVTNAQLKAMIDQGVIAALAARDADRNAIGVREHIS